MYKDNMINLVSTLLRGIISGRVTGVIKNVIIERELARSEGENVVEDRGRCGGGRAQARFIGIKKMSFSTS